MLRGIRTLRRLRGVLVVVASVFAPQAMGDGAAASSSQPTPQLPRIDPANLYDVRIQRELRQNLERLRTEDWLAYLLEAQDEQGHADLQAEVHGIARYLSNKYGTHLITPQVRVALERIIEEPGRRHKHALVLFALHMEENILESVAARTSNTGEQGLPTARDHLRSFVQRDVAQAFEHLRKGTEGVASLSILMYQLRPRYLLK